jgi:hypothetical protein
MWSVVVVCSVALVLAVAINALVTAAIVRSAAPVKSLPPTTPAAPQYSAAEQDSAKQAVCHLFDLATSGQQGQGGMRSNGQLNMPLAIRTLNGVVAIQDALSDAVPQEVSDAAHKYVRSSLEETTAAMSPTVSVDEGNKLNDASITATFALADVCGLPH